MKREAYRHPKMYDLAARLGVTRATAIGYVQLMLDYAADVAPQGNIGKWPDGAIAGACDWTGDASFFVSALVDSGWLDRCPVHRLVIHDLKDHADRWWILKLSKLKLSIIEPSVERSSLPFSARLGSTLPASAQPESRTEGPAAAEMNACAVWAKPDRDAVIEALSSTGLDRAVRVATDAQRSGLTAECVLSIVAEFNANRSKFRSPGAIADRIRSGAWPCGGIKPKEVVAAEHQLKQQQQKTQAAKAELMAIVRSGRREKLTEDQIKAKVREKLPVEICEQEGW